MPRRKPETNHEDVERYAKNVDFVYVRGNDKRGVIQVDCVDKRGKRIQKSTGRKLVYKAMDYLTCKNLLDDTSALIRDSLNKNDTVEMGLLFPLSKEGKNRALQSEKEISKANISLRDLRSEWLEKMESYLKRTTFKQYFNATAMLEESNFFEQPVAELTEEQVVEYRKALQAGTVVAISRQTGKGAFAKKIPHTQDGRRKPLSASRINYIVDRICDLMNFAFSRGYIQTNPLADLKCLPTERYKSDPFEDYELPKLYSAASALNMEQMRRLIITQAETGGRTGELLALFRENVFLHPERDEGEIYIEYSIANETRNFTYPKSEKSYRTIQLSPLAVRALRKQMEETAHLGRRTFIYEGKGGARSTCSGELVFAGQTGNRLTSVQTGRFFKRITEKAGVRHRRMYQLRHTFASQQLMKGGDAEFISKQMGHDDPSTMFKYYRRFLEGEARRKRLKMNKLGIFVSDQDVEV